MTPLRNYLKATTQYDVYTLQLNTSSGYAKSLRPQDLRSLLDVDVWFGQTPIVERAVRRIADHTGKQVTIVGHSHGGREGVIVAVRNPDLVRQVVPVFSPLGDIEEAPNVPVINIWSTADRIIGPHTRLARARCTFSPVNERLGEAVIVDGYRHLAPLRPHSGIHTVIAEQVGNFRQR